MGFLQALFLAGAATFAIPVVIHLIFRTRKETLVFSTLRFLRESLLRESRRLRLRDLLLLLLRCLACILIALAFSRPYREGQLLAGSAGQPRADLLIVLDDSPSLNAQEGAGSRWQTLVGKANALCRERQSGDRVGLIFSSDPARAEVELTGNFSAVEAALKREKPSFRRGDLAQALRTALDLLSGSDAPQRRVVVLSDFQTTQLDRGVWAEIAQTAVAAARPALVELIPPAEKGERRPANLAVTDVRAKSDVWIADRPVPFAIRIENFGSGEVPNLAVRLTGPEGQVLAQRTVGLSPRGAAEIELGAVFPRPGEMHGRVEIDAHDALPDDDCRLFATRLRESVKALVVEDQLRETDTFLDQSYYLRMALDPRARDADAAAATGQPVAIVPSYVRVHTVDALGFIPSAFEETDIVFWVGLSALPVERLAKFEDAVRAGRNLVIFLDRAPGAILPAFYTSVLWKDGEGLLPARPTGRYEGNLLAARYNGVDAFDATHPIFQPFTKEMEHELRRPKFIHHVVLNAEDLKAGKRPAGTVLATFNDGHPFLVERAFGKGRVLVFPFSPRPEASDLVKRKVFVPLIHQVVRYLAGVENPLRRNVIVGEPLVLTEAGVAPETPVDLERPAPLSDSLKLTAAENVTADVAGLYGLSFKRGELVQKAFFSANLDPRESDLISEDISALRALFASNLTRDEADPVARRRLADLSMEERKAQATDWRLLLVAAALCLLLEIWVRDYWGN
jgi:hypothetical protein